MTLLVPFISIFGITGVAWFLKRVTKKNICPICAGVAGTWLWMLIGRFFGFIPDIALLALLMGGSVVGIAYKSEKYLDARRSPLQWKIFFIPLGFADMYSLIAEQWFVFGGFAVILGVGALFFLRTGKSSRHAAEELEEKMKSCC